MSFGENPILKQSIELHLKHQDKIKSKQLVCPYKACSKRFAEKSNLTIHIRIHTGERPYQCDYPNCTKSFITCGNLKSHKNHHLGIKQLKCTFDGCNKAYSQRNRLKAHLRTHFGVKPFNCDYPNCKKSFNDKWNLITHLRTHSGQRPYTCYINDCKKSYGSSSEMKAHLKSHDQSKDKFFCHICPSIFSRYSTVLVHLKMHSESSKQQAHKKVIYFTTNLQDQQNQISKSQITNESNITCKEINQTDNFQSDNTLATTKTSRSKEIFQFLSLKRDRFNEEAIVNSFFNDFKLPDNHEKSSEDFSYLHCEVMDLLALQFEAIEKYNSAFAPLKEIIDYNI